MLAFLEGVAQGRMCPPFVWLVHTNTAQRRVTDVLRVVLCTKKLDDTPLEHQSSVQVNNIY